MNISSHLQTNIDQLFKDARDMWNVACETTNSRDRGGILVDIKIKLEAILDDVKAEIEMSDCPGLGLDEAEDGAANFSDHFKTGNI